MLYACLATVALAVSPLAVSGCGGSSSKAKSAAQASTATIQQPTTATTTSSPTPTTTSVTLASGRPLARARWIAKGDAICALANKKIRAISSVKAHELGRVLPQVAIYRTTEASELSRLVPPGSATHDWTQVVDGFHLYGEYVNRVAQYVQTNNSKSAAPLIHAAEALQKRVNLVAEHNGFSQCSAAK